MVEPIGIEQFIDYQELVLSGCGLVATYPKIFVF